MTARGWMIIGAGAATGAVILAAWLPFSALIAQRHELASATGQLDQLTAQSKQLAAEASRLNTPDELSRLAREQYQLVEPGQRIVQVLTPSGTPSSKSNGGPFPGDPGLSAPVEPGASSLLPSSGAAQATQPAAAAAARPLNGFLSRVVATLEFWR
jgi:cell division protein FtsB